MGGGEFGVFEVLSAHVGTAAQDCKEEGPPAPAGTARGCLGGAAEWSVRSGACAVAGLGLFAKQQCDGA